MATRFPGMDPFLEGQRWEGFHVRCMAVISDVLVPQVRPRYVVEVEERVYVEVFLTLRDRQTAAVVTVIEILSPDNKRPGGTGRGQYLTKRDTVLQSSANLVELDLLRGGARLPTVEPLPPGDYYTFVSRAPQWPEVEVYAWFLPDPLPGLPIPLKEGDPDACLDLEAVFTSVYDRAGYDYSLDYTRPIEPPLSEEAAAWVGQVLELGS